jgi:hypothetical protein
MRASLSGDLSGLLFSAKLKSARSLNRRYGLGQELSFRLFHRFVIYSSYGGREKQFQKSEWNCSVFDGIAPTVAQTGSLRGFIRLSDESAQTASLRYGKLQLAPGRDIC